MNCIAPFDYSTFDCLNETESGIKLEELSISIYHTFRLNDNIFQTIFKYFKSLQHLELKRLDVTENGARDFVNRCETLRTLKLIYCTNITKETTESIQKWLNKRTNKQERCSG